MKQPFASSARLRGGGHILPSALKGSSQNLFQNVRYVGKPTFKAIGTVADRFDVSRTAAAIRLVERDCAPALMVCHGPGGRKWFAGSASVPSRWFPRDELDAESFAFDVLNRAKTDDSIPHKIGAEAWFDRAEAHRHEIREQTMRTGPDEVLSLLLLADDKMLDEGPGQRWSGR